MASFLDFPSRYKIIILGFLTVLFGIVLLFHNLTEPSRFGKSVKLNGPVWKEATKFSHLESGAFVFLALGAQANSLTCPAAVESLVRFGGWDGHVYMITDRESCFSASDIVKNAKMERSKFHLITTEESFSSVGFDAKHSAIGLRKNRVKSFAMKTQLFDFIKDEKIKTVVYADCDIIFTHPGCPNKLITAADKSWDIEKIKFTHFQRGLNTTDMNIQTVHAGSFVVHREHSKEILKMWGDSINSGKYKGDMHAFMALYNSSKIRYDGHTISATEERQLIFPGPYPPGEVLVDPSLKGDALHMQSNWYERFFDIHTAGSNCMTHISKARCSSVGRGAVQSFVNRFKLKSYGEGLYSYCVHPVLQPLMYGWFPFHYLPFCPKLEWLL
jgi:hypothetical protein